MLGTNLLHFIAHGVLVIWRGGMLHQTPREFTKESWIHRLAQEQFGGGATRTGQDAPPPFNLEIPLAIILAEEKFRGGIGEAQSLRCKSKSIRVQSSPAFLSQFIHLAA